MVYGETCPQYLALTAEALDGPNGERFVCAPPLRRESDRIELWRALSDGKLDVVATDHCPFTTEEKSGHADFTSIPGGLGAIEARLSLVHTLGVRVVAEAKQTAVEARRLATFHGGRKMRQDRSVGVSQAR